jgi:hypothetical protein
MDDPETRKQRRQRHTREVEESQKSLRDNIAEAERFLYVSDEMLYRHRGECEANDD